MRYAVAFGRFWWNFVVGDDWRVAAGLAVALGLAYVCTHRSLDAWWLLPVAVAAPARGFAAPRDVSCSLMQVLPDGEVVGGMTLKIEPKWR
jgi:hypothetical protein